MQILPKLLLNLLFFSSIFSTEQKITKSNPDYIYSSPSPDTSGHAIFANNSICEIFFNNNDSLWILSKQENNQQKLDSLDLKSWKTTSYNYEHEQNKFIFWNKDKIIFNEPKEISIDSLDKTTYINLYLKQKWFSVTNKNNHITVFNSAFMELTEINSVQNLSSFALISENMKEESYKNQSDTLVLALYGLEKTNLGLMPTFWMFNFWKLNNPERFRSLSCNEKMGPYAPKFMKFSYDKKWLAIVFEYHVLIYNLE